MEEEEAAAMVTESICPTQASTATTLHTIHIRKTEEAKANTETRKAQA